jgi:hypothetical protein
MAKRGPEHDLWRDRFNDHGHGHGHDPGPDVATPRDRRLIRGLLGGSAAGLLLFTLIVYVDDPAATVDGLVTRPWLGVLVLLTFGAVPGMFLGWGAVWCWERSSPVRDRRRPGG